MSFSPLIWVVVSFSARLKPSAPLGAIIRYYNTYNGRCVILMYQLLINSLILFILNLFFLCKFEGLILRYLAVSSLLMFKMYLSIRGAEYCSGSFLMALIIPILVLLSAIDSNIASGSISILI